jgi:hypothetical protein
MEKTVTAAHKGINIKCKKRRNEERIVGKNGINRKKKQISNVEILMQQK